MDRRYFTKMMLSAMIAYPTLKIGTAMANHSVIAKVDFTKAQWKEKLSKDQYYILRTEGTERSGSSALNHEKRHGVFACAGCDLPLFLSETKYESHSGWPSFFQAIEGHVETKRDWKLLYPRTEYHCARCGGHQGHIFDDGPEPTGLRYCNNGLALNFVLKEDKESRGGT